MLHKLFPPQMCPQTRPFGVSHTLFNVSPSNFITGAFESIWIKIKVNKNEYCIVGNIYRPNTYPKASPSKFNNCLVGIMNYFKFDNEFKKYKIHIMGDFHLYLVKHKNHKPAEEFIDNMYSFGCMPTITKPIRIHNTSATLNTSNTSNLCVWYTYV